MVVEQAVVSDSGDLPVGQVPMAELEPALEPEVVHVQKSDAHHEWYCAEQSEFFDRFADLGRFVPKADVGDLGG